MPALQVREFPEDLYEDLRAYASAHHRSMAQQTIAAVEEVVRGSQSTPSHIIPFEATFEREARLAKRQEVLARAEHRRVNRRKPIPSPLEMLTQARLDRDGEFGALIQEIQEASVTQGTQADQGVQGAQSAQEVQAVQKLEKGLL